MFRNGATLVHVESEHCADKIASAIHSEMPCMAEATERIWQDDPDRPKICPNPLSLKIEQDILWLHAARFSEAKPARGQYRVPRRGWHFRDMPV